MGKMRYKLRGIRPRAVQEHSTHPKLSIVIKGRLVYVDVDHPINSFSLGDVDGSVEALLDVMDSYHSSQCTLDLIHYGVGPITESDIKLAEPFNAIIYAFNIGVVQPNLRQVAKSHKVQIKEHNIIYRLFDDLRAEMEKLLPPVEVEEVIGEANVLQEFIVTEGKHKLPVAGCNKLHIHERLCSSLYSLLKYLFCRSLCQRNVEKECAFSAGTWGGNPI